MRKAAIADREKVVKIISITFETNPGVNWLIKKSGNHSKQVRRLATYAFFKAYLRDGAFLSANEKGAALCYPFNRRVFSIRELLYQLKFALFSLNMWRIPRVLKRESYRKKQRPASGDYLYFWFLGVLPGGEGAVFELRDGIFQLARQENLPIYLETAMERTKTVYERYGFKTFHYWEDKAENIQFWFMKWEP